MNVSNFADKSPTLPTPEQCNRNAKVFETPHCVGYALWYPEMGGYSGRAVALMDKRWTEDESGARTGGCIDIYVWHDGEFPFDDGRSPAIIHHCDPEQFIEFGTTLRDLNDRGRTTS